jgi:serine protease Do
MNELPMMVGSTPVGREVEVEILRKGRKKVIEVEIGKLNEEMETKEEPSESRSDLGMRVEEITPELAQKLNLSEQSGLVVVDVDPSSPAAEAGIRPGDLILEVDQKEVDSLDQYWDAISGYNEGDTVLFLIRRGGNTLYLTLKVWE